jgi:hypothetical protein
VELCFLKLAESAAKQGQKRLILTGFWVCRRAELQATENKTRIASSSNRWADAGHCLLLTRATDVAAATRRAKHLNWCPALPGKTFFFPKDRIYDLTNTSRARYRGRIAIVTTRGAGCGGRERRGGRTRS